MKDYIKIPLNGYEQQISITGNPENPVLLFCHGGPGTPSMSFLRKWNIPLIDDFLLITWDQRGTGRSLTKKLDLSTINISTIVKDTHELTSYIKNRFNKDKLYIMGHSFGATLALQVIKEKPENYLGYFGISQFVNTTKNEAFCYDFVMKQALDHGDKKVIQHLKEIGEPIAGYYKHPLKDLSYVKRMVSKYKGDTRKGNSTLSIIASIFLSREYGFHRFANSIKGIGLSIEKVGLSMKDIAYDETHLQLDVPVYFFSGDYDQLTPQKILRDYYEKLTAPHKEIYLFHNSAHSPLWEEQEKFHKIVHNIKTKDMK